MGGCRCTFRECENGTTSRKDLHYFRFPIRDPERLKVWTKNANRVEFLDLPKDKLANKVVCQEHFERSMFMNHLCERLTRLAIPRLMPLEDSSLLNVETGTIQWSYDDGYNEGSTKEAEVTQSSKAQLSVEKLHTIEDWNDSKTEPAHKKIKILNKEALIFSNNYTPCEIVHIQTSTSSTDRPRKMSHVISKRVVVPGRPTSSETSPIDSPEDRHMLLEVQGEVSTDDTYGQDEVQSSLKINPVAKAASSGNDIPTSSIAVPTTPPAPRIVPVVDPVLIKKLEQNNLEIVQLQKMVQTLLDRSSRPQPHAVVAQPAVPQNVVMEKGPHLTKAQLFNSIKRYLNPTMVTLLRMELFSGPADRQWKPDEKTLAVDLLNIGEPVYDNFTEEFRFRLPSKTDVKKWKEEGEIDVDDAC